MNNLDLTHLETLLAAATPGPWEYDGRTGICANNSPDEDAVCIAYIEDDGGYEASHEERIANGKLITALRNAAPALIARVRELEEWMPIETAPKSIKDELQLWDGKSVLSPCSHFLGEWEICAGDAWRSLKSTPTHWKHLPKPPTE